MEIPAACPAVRLVDGSGLEDALDIAAAEGEAKAVIGDECVAVERVIPCTAVDLLFADLVEV